VGAESGLGMETDLKVDFVGLMGQGVARDDNGNQYFIPGALPGDFVRVGFLQTEKRYRDAELLKVLTPSENRTAPACEKFEVCGGCDWMHWSYPAQVRAKQQILDHVLERGGWLPEKTLEAVKAETTLGYRNRIQLHLGFGQVGFYKRKSHQIVDIEQCPIAHPKINEALALLRKEEASGEKSKVELALLENGEVVRSDNQPNAVSGFTQVHDEQNEALRKLVAFEILSRGAESVLELFSGNGNLTRGYASSVKEVFCVDSSEPALAQARTHFNPEGPRMAFLHRHIDSKLSKGLPRDFKHRYDTLLLDPPRSGAEACIQPLIHEGLKTVVYVSCSPVAFTKDVQCLKENFRFDQVQIIDMFPHTRHVEFCAVFSRLLS
jgi:23S rRNA (uracil1939-C5)-methyltransferase